MLRVVPSRTVGGGHLRQGFCDNLRPRLARRSGDAAAELAVRQLERGFATSRQFAKGAPVDFVCHAGGVVVYAGGEKLTEMLGADVGAALMDIYLAPDTKTPNVRRDVGRGIAHAIEAEL